MWPSSVIITLQADIDSEPAVICQAQYSTCYETEEIPKQWKDVDVICTFKKSKCLGDSHEKMEKTTLRLTSLASDLSNGTRTH